MSSRNSVAQARAVLLNHPLRQHLDSLAAWQIFMQFHVFAVWDFMSLVKRLQRELTCVRLPWLPPQHPDIARFINEVVLAEESDTDGHGGHISHFELYLGAMRELDVSTDAARNLVSALHSGESVEHALSAAQVPSAAATFVRHTLKVAEHGSLAEVAAVFLHGREDLLPDMFAGLLPLTRQLGAQAKQLERYLSRHIELDSQEHGPAAQKIEAALCSGTPAIQAQAQAAAEAALMARIQLWDGILEAIRAPSRSPC